jgi:ubiquilin
LSTYKISSGNTIHLVRGKPKPAAPPPAAQVPEQFSAGQQIAGNPLAPLLNAQNAGAFGALGNPFAQMGINTNDPNMVCRSALLGPHGCVELMSVGDGG